MGFLRFLTLPGPNHAQNGFPIVQLMFLYEARARARLVQEHQLHNWDPVLLSHFVVGMRLVTALCREILVSWFQHLGL